MSPRRSIQLTEKRWLERRYATEYPTLDDRGLKATATIGSRYARRRSEIVGRNAMPIQVDQLLFFRRYQLPMPKTARRFRLKLRRLIRKSWFLSRCYYRYRGARLRGRPRQEVWYFAYGANMDDGTFRTRRGIHALELSSRPHQELPASLQSRWPTQGQGRTCKFAPRPRRGGLGRTLPDHATRLAAP